MSDYFGDRPSNDESIFVGASGDGYRRSQQDLFGGDFYADEEQTTRGVSFGAARAPGHLDAFGKVDPFPFGKQEFAQRAGARLVFPGCEGVDLEVKDVPAGLSNGKSYYVSAQNGTELALALMDYFAQQDGVALPREQKRAIKAHLCVKYELLKVKVSLCIPAEAPQYVAMTWERKAGDSLEFGNAARGCSAYLQERGLRCTEPADRNVAFAADPVFGLPTLPPLGDEWGVPPRPGFGAPPPLSLGEKTPNFLLDLPALAVEPCTAGEMQGLIDQAAEPYAESKREAAVELCKICDGETDAPAVHQTVTSQVLLGLIQEPACALAAPALAEKLVPHCPALDWAAVATALAARLPSEPALGQRASSKALQAVLHYHPVSLDVSALEAQCQDNVARRRLQEARFALGAQAA